MDRGILILKLLLARQFLHLNRLELKQKDHKAINLDLLHNLFQLEEALSVEFLELWDVDVRLHLFDVLDLKQEALDDVSFSAQLWV